MTRYRTSLPIIYWWAPLLILLSHGLLRLGLDLKLQTCLWLMSALPISLWATRRRRQQLRRGVLLACEFMVDPTVEELRQRATELKLGEPEYGSERDIF